jgi:hypothetical protein
MPRLLISATGILLVPAPALPIARTEAAIGIAFMFWDRTRIATGEST